MTRSVHNPFAKFAWRLASSAAFCVLSTFCLTRTAFAHRDFFNATIEAGSGSLAQQSLSGQWGIAPTSPFYVYGELSHEAFYLSPDDNSLRVLAEVGYESVHLGLSLRGGYMSGAFQSLSFNQIGGTLFYRFVRWTQLNSDEKLFLKNRDRKALIEQHIRETNEDIPKAPLAAFSFDQFSVSSSLSQVTAINPARLSAWIRAGFEPFWTFIPSLAFYQYTLAPSLDPAGYTSYSSRALRLVKLGPDGMYSGIFGMPDNTQQIYSQIKLFPMLQIDAAITRVSLNTPSYVGYSFWIGFDRFLTPDKRWAVSPSYEQYFLEGKAYSYFAVSFRLGAGGSWLPSQDKP